MSFGGLDDETFKDILTPHKYEHDLKEQQDNLKRIIENKKLDKWLDIKKKEDFLPRTPYFLEEDILKYFSLYEIKVLSTSNRAYSLADILSTSVRYGTIKNVSKVIKNNIEDGIEVRISKPENYTDEYIELFGIKNIESFGNKIIENEQYLKNYKYIKENYGQMFFDSWSESIDVLSDKYVELLGYENIYKFFNNSERKFEFENKRSQKLKNIPIYYTKKQMEQIISIYGDVPQFKGLYNEKIIEIIRKSCSK